MAARTVTNQLLIARLRSQDSAAVTQVLQRLKGVYAVRVTPSTGTVQVVHAPEVALSSLIQALNRAGYMQVSVLV